MGGMRSFMAIIAVTKSLRSCGSLKRTIYLPVLNNAYVVLRID
jgi:predicted small lipoprotein YifL